MRTDIIDYLEKEIKYRCSSRANFFGMGVFYHIRAVADNAAYLAKEYGADVEIVTIAAWLHDIASITDYNLYDEHHIHGMAIAEQILSEFSYEPEKIERVKKCIYSHRGNKQKEKLTLEEICVADADAISHFDSVPSLFYLAYVNRNLNIEEGTEFVKNKLRRSYNKLSERSKETYKQKYDSIMNSISP